MNFDFDNLSNFEITNNKILDDVVFTQSSEWQIYQ